MTEINDLDFETSNLIKTSDDFELNIKGSIKYKDEKGSYSESLLDDFLFNYFKTMELSEALKMMDSNTSDQIFPKLSSSMKSNSVQILDFQIFTIDAKSKSTTSVDISIDPSLEAKQEKKKGLFSKLFRKK